MLNLLLAQAQDHIESLYGPEAWIETLVQANMTASRGRTYAPREDEVLAVMQVAAARTSTPVNRFLHEMGVSLALSLAARFAATMAADVRAIDVVAQACGVLVSQTSHRVNSRRPTPRLTFEKEGEALHVAFYAPRLLCPAVRGLVEGTADALGQRLEARQTFCMYHGDAFCEFQVHQPAAYASRLEGPARNA